MPCLFEDAEYFARGGFPNYDLWVSQGHLFSSPARRHHGVFCRGDDGTVGRISHSKDSLARMVKLQARFTSPQIPNPHLVVKARNGHIAAIGRKRHVTYIQEF